MTNPDCSHGSPRFAAPALLLLALLSACVEEPPRALGQLESDRIEVVAEAAEPIIAIEVAEGERVEAGQSLIRQDTSRLAAREQELQAAAAQLEALLAEQTAGPREEVIEAARAAREAAEVDVELARIEHQRLQTLSEGNLASRESLDRARARVDAALAAQRAAAARLAELEAGTRPEQVEQTRQQLVQARARLRQLHIDMERLNSRAPVAAVVDSLPFETGERPPAGSVIAVLLAGGQPHARVYVPEALRVHLAPGDPATVFVDGLAAPLEGRIRNIAHEAAFTPYFALSERDRGRLSYLAEIVLPVLPERLPDGMPVEVLFPGMEPAP